MFRAGADTATIPHSSKPRTLCAMLETASTFKYLNMTWNNIKQSIKTQLLSRNLVNPNIRLNALDHIETIIDKKFISNPIKLLSIHKQVLKDQLGKKKKLNSAESSIINHIYDVLNGNPIPRRK